MSSSINPRGAVDLSALAANRQAEKESATARATAAPGSIIDVTEANFQTEVVERSKSVPVLIDFWADWCGPCKQLSPILEKLTAEYAGQIVLAKVDADANPRLSAAFQVQSIPSVFLVLAGQPQALFQGAVPEAQLRPLFEQIVKAAAQAGMSAGAETDGATEPVAAPADPRYERAYAAVEAGDWAAATAAFQEILNQSPAEEDAKAGIAQVALMQRLDGVDIAAAASAVMANIDDRLLRADALLIMNQPAQAFDLLIDGVRSSTGDERMRYKDRLLELFLVVGNSEVVLEARKKLTNALF